MPENVECHRSLLLAIVANDTDPRLLVFGGHWCLGDLSIHLRPQILILVKRNVADRAAERLQTCARELKFPQAILMDRVPTLQDGHLEGRLKEVLETHRAILPHGVLHAYVRVPNLVRVATTASITMEVVIAATNPADSTSRTMENLFLDAFVVPEVASPAKIFPEDLATGEALP